MLARVRGFRLLYGVMFVIMVGLGAMCPIALADATTTLTFDDLSDGTVVTTQYQSLGV